jgi:hypothetical protein
VTGRRRLSGGTISTTQARQPDSSPGGRSGTVIMGRKGYAVEVSIKAKALWTLADQGSSERARGFNPG